MANKTFRDVQHLSPFVKILDGSFQTNGTSDPTAVSGTGFTVAHTSTGLYTVTLSDTYPKHSSVTATLEAPTYKDFGVQITAIDVSGAGTIGVMTVSGTNTTAAGGAEWDWPDSDDVRVNFQAILKNSSAV